MSYICNMIYKKFIVTKPSVVQHIGIKSIMGHNETIDVACDF